MSEGEVAFSHLAFSHLAFSHLAFSHLAFSHLAFSHLMTRFYLCSGAASCRRCPYSGAAGRGLGKSGVVTSRALYVSPNPVKT
ncbi:MAG: hypothetical protein WCA59_01480 [Candidatus Binataceae bacterium]